MCINYINYMYENYSYQLVLFMWLFFILIYPLAPWINYKFNKAIDKDITCVRT